MLLGMLEIHRSFLFMYLPNLTLGILHSDSSWTASSTQNCICLSPPSHKMKHRMH
uniref:Uncharacterized protein n=1 Tax=Anguilla anguilla TaxID=7936 RepID=A0A0E9S7K0_ANGAN